jgi:hypothetical protein
MSTIQKEIIDLLTLAKCFKEESSFGQCDVYQAFKARPKIGQRSEIKLLIVGMAERKFSNECIFWAQRFFKERVCNKEERIRIFFTLSCMYYKMEHYEKAIEFGQKYLEIKSEKPLDRVSAILELMVDSCNILEEKEERIKYRKENLKIKILRCNNGEIDQFQVLQAYYDLIASQFKNNHFSCAKKTMKNLKLFNLNSKDPNDVRASLDNKEYLKHFTNLMDIEENQELFRLVGRLCFYKSRVLEYFGDKKNCLKWANLYFEILYDIQHNSRQMERNATIITEDKTNHDSIICETIFSVLNLTNNDYVNREKLYLKVYLATLQSKRFISYYIGEVVREYSINFDCIMPFLQFCIKIFDEAVSQNPPSWPIEEGRKKLMAYKNSLFIKKHFYTNLLKEGNCLHDRKFQ